MNLKIYIDTNIYINSILNRDDGISQDLLIFLDNADVQLYLNDISVINIHYIISKYLDRNDIKNELKTIREKHYLVSVDNDIIDDAFDSGFKDFEDGVQYFCAKRVDVDVIITDNIKDFKLSEIKVMTAKEFHSEFID